MKAVLDRCRGWLPTNQCELKNNIFGNRYQWSSTSFPPPLLSEPKWMIGGSQTYGIPLITQANRTAQIDDYIDADQCFCTYIDKCRRINGFVIINVINRLNSTKFTIVAMPYGKVCLVTFKNLKQTIKQFLEGFNVSYGDNYR